jgi:hypothetical protein
VTARHVSRGKPRINLRQRGQGLVEFTIVVPVFLLLLFAMLDFGLAFYSNLTIAYASREGARVGAALADGGGASGGCGTGEVDKYVIAAVERVLDSAGIRIDVDPSGGGGVTSVRIYKADATTGADPGGVANQWTYSAGGGPVIPGTTTPLDFVETSHGWNVCSRVNSIAAPDSIGVSISYSYAYITPLAGIYQFMFKGPPPTLKIFDRTVMQLNPTG